MLRVGPGDVAVWQWIALLIAIALGYLVGRVLAAVIVRVTHAMTRRTDTSFDDVLLARLQGPLRALLTIAIVRALLPMIESAYNPYAYSRSHASGMWQFIRSTGKTYGLKQTFWYDGRRDAIAATNAALDYLQDLHEMFGSWDLALAAYNLGENGMTRAIARNRARKQPVEYDKLRLPRETRNYFPKLQAIKNIIADPARFGLPPKGGRS